jgi:hypothetical protein
VPLRDVQEAASHADPRTTMRYAEHGPASTDTLHTSLPPTSPGQPGRAQPDRRQSDRDKRSDCRDLAARPK